MDMLQLEIELKKLGVPNHYYAINGNLVADTYILNHIYNKWEYFYFDEKGNRVGYKEFDNESEALMFLFEKLKNVMKYFT